MTKNYIAPQPLDDDLEVDVEVPETDDDNPFAAQPAADDEFETVDTIWGKVTRKKVPPKPRVQGENEAEDAPFRVGLPHPRYAHERVALPSPRWPNPGELESDELAEEMNREFHLKSQADTALRRLLEFHSGKAHYDIHPEWENEVGRNDRLQCAAANRSFLHGIWQSRGIPIPSDEQLEAWAKEDAEAKRLEFEAMLKRQR
jgi:hypothetical protein